MEYLVNVGVHGVSAITFGDKDYTLLPNPYVVVTVFDLAPKMTHHLATSASGSFDYIFTFRKHMEPEDFISEDVKIEVYDKGTIYTTLLGQVLFSLKSVWKQPMRTVKKDWVPLVVSTAPGEVRGFVQLTVGAYGPGDTIPRAGTFETQMDDDGSAGLRSRLVVPPSESDSKSVYQLTVGIHAGEGIRQLPTTFATSVEPFVQVSFNGTEQDTKVSSGSTPLWNEDVKVPFMMPCWDDSINVILFSSGGMTGNNVKLGSFELSISELQEKDQPPTWYNFYYSPEEEDQKGYIYDGLDAQAASAFAGRLLVSARMAHSEKPIFGVSSGSAGMPPAKTKCSLWLDLYELVFDLPHLPGMCKVTVSMKPLAEEWPFGECEKHDHSFLWDDSEGRRGSSRIEIPSDLEMASDLFISVETKEEAGYVMEGTWVRHMYCCLSVKDIWNWNQAPDWHDFKLCVKEGNHTPGGFALMSINIGPAREDSKRDKRVKVNLKQYMFHAHIYQAVNLSCKDEQGTSDPKIIMFFGAAMIKSSVISQSVTPCWHESKEEIVELPDSADLWPDIHIYICDIDDDGLEPIAFINYKTSDAGALPEVWEGPPKWLHFEKLSTGPVTQAQILISFELIPLDKPGGVDDLEPIDLKRIDCRVEVFTVGVRMFQGHQDEINKPIVEFTWGRQVEDRARPETKNRAAPVQHAFVQEVKSGEHGHYNFLERAALVLPLAEDPVNQEYLEVKLLTESADGEHVLPIAFGFIHLTPMLPWVSTRQAASIKKQFQLLTYEELKLAWERRQAVVPGLETAQSQEDLVVKKTKVKSKGWKRVHEGLMGHGMSVLETRLCSAIGWNHSDIAASNHTTLEYKELVNVTEDDQKDNDDSLSRIKIQRSNGVKKKKKAEEELKLAAKQARKKKIGFKRRKKELHPGLNLPPAQSFGFDTKVDVITETAEAVDNFAKDFDWPIYKDDGQDALNDHPEFENCLEPDQLPESELPYLRVPLFVGSSWGEQVTIGILKCCVRVVEEEKRIEGGPDYEEEQQEWRAMIRDLKQRFEEAKYLAVRCYMLSADGLIPQSGKSDPTTYLWSRTSEDDGDRQNCDMSAIREHSLHPEFFKVHVFDRCQLPQDCLLECKVIEQVAGMLGGETHQEVGNTVMDIEDRWFHPRFTKWMQDDTVPIECRPIHIGKSMFNHGVLRLFIEVLSSDDQNTRPIISLPSVEPKEFQLRMVIWKAMHLHTEDDTNQPDVYIIAKHVMDDGTELTQQTDVHYACEDEMATWNWRMLFDVKIPCRNARVNLVMWDHNVVYSSEPIADCTLDFSKDFLQAKKRDETIEIPKDKIPMDNPAKPGEQRAELHLEATLMPAEDAAMNPVGEGREEPNQDPFVDGANPHLVKHRGYLNTSAAVQNIKAVGGMLLFGGFGMVALFYIGSAIGSLVGGIVTLYLITKD